jgi:hypothetical protein
VKHCRFRENPASGPQRRWALFPTRHKVRLGGPVSPEAFAGFWEFDLVTGNELIIGSQSGFVGRRQVHFMDQLLRFALNAFGHFIQDIGRLVNPATLLGD